MGKTTITPQLQLGIGTVGENRWDENAGLQAGCYKLVAFKEVDHGIWLVSFMDYDLGYMDLEEKTLQPMENPFGPKV